MCKSGLFTVTDVQCVITYFRTDIPDILSVNDGLVWFVPLIVAVQVMVPESIASRLSLLTLVVFLPTGKHLFSPRLLT